MAAGATAAGGTDGRGPAERRGTGPDERRPTERRPRGPAEPVARIYMGTGRQGGIRPQDLVAAITGQSGIPAGDIGTIEIADRFSVVELPERVIDPVLHAMRNSRINGRKVPVRRFVEKQGR